MPDDQSAEVETILRNVDDVLATAKLGLADLLDPSRKRRMSGLRNVLAFGRSVTFVIQNLRGKVIDFDGWYAPRQEEMKADSLMRYMVLARNELEKQGKLSVTTNTFIAKFGPGDERHFGPPPPGAEAMFIGDPLGGSGWRVRLPDGSTESYYIDLPESVGVSTQIFTNLESARAGELKDIPIDALCARYLDQLTALVVEARKRFGKPRGRPLLRLVK